MDGNIPEEKQKPNKNKKTFFTKKIKGIASLLKNSSNFWKGTINDFGKNICQCTRQELDEDEPKIIQENITMLPPEQMQPKIQSQDHREVALSPVKSQDCNNLQPAADNTKISQNKNRVWLPEEDNMLINFINQHKGRNWRKISSIIQTKSPQQCSYRYNRLMAALYKKKFTRNDDILLIEYIETFGKNWDLISKYMDGHTSEDLKERYEKKLDPNLKRCKFGKEEDELILQMHEEHGNDWKEIAKYFPDRNAYMIRNRYYSFLKKKPRDNCSSIMSNTINTFSETSSIGSYYYPDVNSTPQGEVNLNRPAGRRTVSYHNAGVLKLFNDQQSKKENDCNLYSCAASEDEISAKIEALNMLGPDPSSTCLPIVGKSLVNQIQIPTSGNHPLSLGFDEREEDFLSKDLAKIQTDSPKEQCTDDNKNNFNEQYYNAFKPTRKFFDENMNDIMARDNISKTIFNEAMNNSNDNQESLIKQYQKLDEIFHKLSEITCWKMSAHKLKLSNIHPERRDKLICLERELADKENSLKSSLAYRKGEYLSLMDKGGEYQREGDRHKIEVNDNLIQNSIITQIELLIELINTSKLKINLMQQIESSIAAGS